MTLPARADDRFGERFALTLPITLEGEEGITLDLSADGILLETRARPDVGTQVCLQLDYEGDRGPCRLRCAGEVVRVDRLGETCNVAVRLHEPLFR